MDHGTQTKLATRAAELLSTANAVLREEPGHGLHEVSARIGEAMDGLARARRAPRAELGEIVHRSNLLLGDAVQLVRERRPDLPGRAKQSMETVRRAIILLNGVTRHSGQAQTPPPLPYDPGRHEPPPDVAERRRAPRAFLAAEVTFSSTDNFYNGFTEDVSEGGLFVATYDLQPVGTSMDLEFTLPTAHTVRVEGEVRWVRDPRDETPDAPPGMGIRFGELRPEDLEAIQSFVRQREPLFYDE